MMEGPKPNVDYGKIAASLPKINAQIEFIDEGFFKYSRCRFEKSFIDEFYLCVDFWQTGSNLSVINIWFWSFHHRRATVTILLKGRVSASRTLRCFLAA